MKEILKFLKNTENSHPKKRGIYCILGGNYGGEFFVFLEEAENNFTFISLPNKEVRHVPKNSFNMGIKNKLVEYIECLPKRVFKVVEKEYNLLNTINEHSSTKTNN